MSKKKIKNPVNITYAGDGFVLSESSLIVLRGRSWFLTSRNISSSRSHTTNNEVDPLVGYRICLKIK